MPVGCKVVAAIPVVPPKAATISIFATLSISAILITAIVAVMIGVSQSATPPVFTDNQSDGDTGCGRGQRSQPGPLAAQHFGLCSVRWPAAGTVAR